MKYPLLYKLNKEDLKYVSENVRLTKHGRSRLKERFNYDLYPTIKKAIITSPIAFVENDGNLCIGTSDGGAFKFVQPRGGKENKFLLITFHEPSINNKDLTKKYRLTLRGHNR